MALRNALGNPHNVADLLLLQFHVRVEHAEVELLHEGKLVEMHLVVSSPRWDAFEQAQQ